MQTLIEVEGVVAIDVLARQCDTSVSSPSPHSTLSLRQLTLVTFLIKIIATIKQRNDTTTMELTRAKTWTFASNTRR